MYVGFSVFRLYSEKQKFKVEFLVVERMTALQRLHFRTSWDQNRTLSNQGGSAYIPRVAGSAYIPRNCSLWGAPILLIVRYSILKSYCFELLFFTLFHKK